MLIVSLPISVFLAQDFVYERGSEVLRDLDVGGFSKLGINSRLHSYNRIFLFSNSYIFRGLCDPLHFAGEGPHVTFSYRTRS